MPAILDGIRVLDFGRFIAGPFCAAMLADLGAEVIRVERPGGGDDRYLMPAFEDREGAMYLQANRGKKAITLDFANPEGMAVARRLIASSDVVVANFSNSALTHFGLDYQSLRAIREDIILTSIGAFDSRSAMRDAVGFDGVGQAISGAIHLTGEPGRPYRSATSYVDYSTAISAAFGTLAAIIRRMKNGEGSHVEATLAGTALNVMNAVLIEQFTGSNIREPIGNRSPIAGPSDMFRARDGWFIMQVIGQSMFRRWTKLVRRPDLLDDPLYADDISRGRNGAALSAIMAEWAADRTRAECLALISAANIASSPVLTPADVMGGAMGLADTYLQTIDFPGSNGIPIARAPARIASEEEVAPVRPPLLGEHNESIFAGLGLDADEIAALRAQSII
jgi:crotonobetainyl-CoA:carnitine CoA-transferase CaiB-like acyl-CoA transferase